jgi:hypothetical protein
MDAESAYKMKLPLYMEYAFDPSIDESGNITLARETVDYKDRQGSLMLGGIKVTDAVIKYHPGKDISYAETGTGGIALDEETFMAAPLCVEMVFGYTDFPGDMPPADEHGAEYDIKPLFTSSGDSADRESGNVYAALSLNGLIAAFGETVTVDDSFAIRIISEVSGEERFVLMDKPQENGVRGIVVISQAPVTPADLPEFTAGNVIPMDTGPGKRFVMRCDDGSVLYGRVVYSGGWKFRVENSPGEIQRSAVHEQMRKAAYDYEDSNTAAGSPVEVEIFIETAPDDGPVPGGGTDGDRGAGPVTGSIRLELGYNLLKYADTGQGGTLPERTGLLRDRIADEWGWIFGPVRILDNPKLYEDDYRILINGIETGKGSLQAEMLLAIQPDYAEEQIPGEHIAEPVWDRPAVWISPDSENEAAEAGYTVVQPEEIIITHLERIIVDNSGIIIGPGEIDALLEELKTGQGDLADRIISAPENFKPLLLNVLRDLLFEGIHVKDFESITGAVLDNMDNAAEYSMLLSAVRAVLNRQIISGCLENSCMNACLFPEDLGDELRRSMRGNETLNAFIVSPAGSAVLDRVSEKYWPCSVIIADSDIRFAVHVIFKKAIPEKKFTVITKDEIPPDIECAISGVESPGGEIYPVLFFGMLHMISDTDLAVLADCADRKNLAASLKAIDEDLLDKVFGAIDENKSRLLKEEMDFMGPITLRQNHMAQKRIVNLARRLAGENRIRIFMSGGDDELVI